MKKGKVVKCGDLRNMPVWDYELRDSQKVVGVIGADITEKG